jgi:hypothetical protein
MPATGALENANSETIKKSLQQLCGIIGSQASNPYFMPLLQSQLKAMGLGDMSNYVQTLQQTCAAPAQAVQ